MCRLSKPRRIRKWAREVKCVRVRMSYEQGLDTLVEIDGSPTFWELNDFHRSPIRSKSSTRSILTVVRLLFMSLLYPTHGLFRCLTSLYFSLRPVVLLLLKHPFTLYARTFCLIVRDFLRLLGHRSDTGPKAGKKVEIWGHWGMAIRHLQASSSTLFRFGTSCSASQSPASLEEG
jgi:hypothetical protein